MVYVVLFNNPHTGYDETRYVSADLVDAYDTLLNMAAIRYQADQHTDSKDWSIWEWDAMIGFVQPALFLRPGIGYIRVDPAH